MAEDWRTPAFRQNVVGKIEEAIRHSGMATSRNSGEMENHVFNKAKSREEYLGFVARLILHVREMNSKKGAGMNGPGGGQMAPGVPDPINALQNLANQGGGAGNRPMGTQPTSIGNLQQQQQQQQQQMPQNSNLLQTLNRGPGNAMAGMQGNIPASMQARTALNMQQNTGAIPTQMNSQMGGQIPNQMGNQIPNSNMAQMPTQIQNTLASQLQGQINQMGAQLSGQIPGQLNASLGGSMAGQLQNQINSQIQNQLLGQMQSLQQRKSNEGIMNAPNAGFPRNPTPTHQFLRQSPSPSVQSPVTMSVPPPSNQMVSSPALAPSPGSQINLMSAQRSIGMAPSPSSSLNTPSQPNQSPMGMQEEQAYREKVRHLSKYIEPLRRMIQKMGNDDVEKMSKMKKLLEILSNPSQRVPLDTLLKCEIVLDKLDFKRSDGSVGAPVTSHLTFKEHHFFNPLLEAISNNLHSSVINHTLYRTFGPTLDALFGPELKLVPPLKRMTIEEPISEIPDVLQGEIARLDQRFKVSLDPNQQPGSKTIQLICWLDDKHLPCVPPISLTVPEDYPMTSPKCHMAAHEYNATQFLSAVQSSLLARIKKLPKHFSVSQLLDTWEMSVRQASAPT